MVPSLTAYRKVSFKNALGPKTKQYDCEIFSNDVRKVDTRRIKAISSQPIIMPVVLQYLRFTIASTCRTKSSILRKEMGN